LCFQGADCLQRFIKIKKVVSAGICSKGNDRNFTAFYNKTRDIANFTGVCDLQGVKDLARASAAVESEIHGVILGQSHGSEARIFQILAIASRHTKGKACADLFTFALGGVASVYD